MSPIEDTPALTRLDAALTRTSIDAEALLVGGAVLTVAFAHDPGSRRPSRVLGDPAELDDATADVASEAESAPDWLSTAVRDLMASRGTAYSWQGDRLSVFAPRPEYALALKCAELNRAEPGGERYRALESDVRYLLRLLELRTAEDVLLEVGRYFTVRQLGAGIDGRIETLLT